MLTSEECQIDASLSYPSNETKQWSPWRGCREDLLRQFKGFKISLTRISKITWRIRFGSAKVASRFVRDDRIVIGSWRVDGDSLFPLTEKLRTGGHKLVLVKPVVTGGLTGFTQQRAAIRNAGSESVLHTSLVATDRIKLSKYLRMKTNLLDYGKWWGVELDE